MSPDEFVSPDGWNGCRPAEQGSPDWRTLPVPVVWWLSVVRSYGKYTMKRLIAILLIAAMVAVAGCEVDDDMDIHSDGGTPAATSLR